MINGVKKTYDVSTYIQRGIEPVDVRGKIVLTFSNKSEVVYYIDSHQLYNNKESQVRKIPLLLKTILRYSKL